MKNYQTAITVADLKKLLEKVPDNAKLIIEEGHRSFMVERVPFLPHSSIAADELIFVRGMEIWY